MTLEREKFCLTWNDFQQNITESYRDIRKNQDFSDVTLVCEEDQQIEAHRVILSACSPSLMNLLRKNKHSHPMIYMRGIKFKNLAAIIDFIYHGQANIYQEDLNDFLELAEELHLKGLTGKDLTGEIVDENKIIPKQNTQIPAPPIRTSSLKTQIQNVVKKEYSTEYSNNLSDIGVVSLSSENRTPVVETVPVGNTKELDDQINLMIQKVEGSSNWVCTMCGKTAGHKHNLMNHIEANHIQGLEHPCTICGKISRSRHALRMHIRGNHGDQSINNIISGQHTPL